MRKAACFSCTWDEPAERQLLVVGDWHQWGALQGLSSLLCARHCALLAQAGLHAPA